MAMITTFTLKTTRMPVAPMRPDTTGLTARPLSDALPTG
jgi:hypothetical protein